MPKAHHLNPSLSHTLVLRLTALRAGLRAALRALFARNTHH
ncbi:MAG TPA: hypothetical protein PK620_08280 [Denitromonas sp.]|nr:hypothetical protein [Denitromonas sp.]HQV14900.1 hypothetical protein [Denitromonas sp.]